MTRTDVTKDNLKIAYSQSFHRWHMHSVDNQKKNSKICQGMTFLTLFGLRNLGEISLILFPYKLFSHSFSLSSVDLYLFLKLQNLDSKV